MGFEETMVGFEERVVAMANVLSTVIGLGLILLSLTSLMDYDSFKPMKYAVLAAAVLLFPLALSTVFKNESFVQSPPPIIKKKKK